MALQTFCVSRATGIVGAVRMPTKEDGGGRALASRVACSATAAAAAATSAHLSKRRTANYQPNLWNYDSLHHRLITGPASTDEKANVTHIEKLKEDVRHMLYLENKLEDKLEFINVLQNIGLAYQFEEEIRNVMGSIRIKNACEILEEDFHATALLFRLLRENGFHISQDVFNAFKDDNGGFKECICKDPQGMLSLYEASHLAYQGEDLLVEGRAFTAKHLNEFKPHLDAQLKEKIERAMELPSHWRSARLDIKWHIEQYEEEGNVEPFLFQLAKLDFNRMQSIHRQELQRMTWWWRNLGVANKLPFVRDRLVECFFFATGVVPTLNFGNCREEISKVCNLITTIDDIYDSYGSLDELGLFTDAINKWEFSATKGFPEYLKTCYSAIYDTTNKIADNITSEDGQDIRLLLKRAWSDICSSFLVEAKWQSSGYIPTLEEYLENGWISVSGPLILVHFFVLSRQTKETRQYYLENYPNFFRSSSMIFRLCNDLATTVGELERGHAVTSITCYMHQYGISEEIARKEIKRLINNTWQKLNKEVADCSTLPRSLTTAAINLARISHSIYHKGDGIGAPDEEEKNQIESIFLDAITVQGEEE